MPRAFSMVAERLNLQIAEAAFARGAGVIAIVFKDVEQINPVLTDESQNRASCP
jgi:hypothetical protein